MSESFIFLIFLAGLAAGVLMCSLIVLPSLHRSKRQLLTDPESGLPNHNGFLQFLHSNRHSKGSFILFLLDLDDFRRFNRMGYDTGDDVLRHFATQLNEMVSDLAYCSRYRLGDEFLVVTSQANHDAIVAKLEKLNQRVVFQNKTVPFQADYVHFTYGSAPISKDDDDASLAIKLAHVKMNELKMQHRASKPKDNVLVAQEQMS